MAGTSVTSGAQRRALSRNRPTERRPQAPILSGTSRGGRTPRAALHSTRNSRTARNNFSPRTLGLPTASGPGASRSDAPARSASPCGSHPLARPRSPRWAAACVANREVTCKTGAHCAGLCQRSTLRLSTDACELASRDLQREQRPSARARRPQARPPTFTPRSKGSCHCKRAAADNCSAAAPSRMPATALPCMVCKELPAQARPRTLDLGPSQRGGAGTERPATDAAPA